MFFVGILVVWPYVSKVRYKVCIYKISQILVVWPYVSKVRYKVCIYKISQIFVVNL
jgi:hypothetical protein